MLAETPLAPDFPMRDLALGTPGLSGSDLKELCRNAVMVGVRQSMRAMREKGEDFADMAKPGASVRLRLSLLSS